MNATFRHLPVTLNSDGRQQIEVPSGFQLIQIFPEHAGTQTMLCVLAPAAAGRLPSLAGMDPDEYRRLCLRAFENLPTDTSVTLDDVDSILTWCANDEPGDEERLAREAEQRGKWLYDVLTEILEKAGVDLNDPDIAAMVRRHLAGRHPL